MTKITKRLGVVAGTCFAVASALNFVSYYSKPVIPEAELLKSTAAYVQRYEGESPKEAIQYAQDTLKIAQRNNALLEDVKGLEKELVGISEGIGESKNPVVYRPVLKEFGSNIEKIADKNSRSSWALWVGILHGVASLAWLANPYTWRRDD